MSVVAGDLPGPPQLALPKNFPDKDVIFMKVQHELTRAREDVRGGDIRACYEGLPANDPASLCGRTIPNSARTARPSRDLFQSGWETGNAIIQNRRSKQDRPQAASVSQGPIDTPTLIARTRFKVPTVGLDSNVEELVEWCR